MQILSVTLKNFKSHRDRHFIFQPGTNAICGENGAGKTSILEAIAWTLFNYRGDYRKEDFIHNDASSAQATVTFISSHDGRTYDAQRCTSKGYALYDPQLNHRLPYNRIDEDVMPWMRQHLGVAPGTDLARLFANTIGVPQGTFTADFLQPAEKRKQVFDSVLKVEEFKQVYTRLGSLKKYSEGLVDALKREVAQYEEALQEQDSLNRSRDEMCQQIEKNQAVLQGLETQLVGVQEEKDRLAQQAQRVQTQAANLKQLQIQLEAKQREIGGHQKSIEQARQAVQQCDIHRQGYETYQQAEARLQQLEQRGKQQRSLLKQRETHQQERVKRDVERAKLATKLESLNQTQSELDALKPLVQQQDQLDKQQANMQQHLQLLKQYAVERHNLEQHIQRLRQEWKQLAQDIDRIEALGGAVAQISDLEQMRDRLQSQLSRVEAAQQFEQELRQLVTEAQTKRDRHQSEVETALAILTEMQQAVPILSSESVEQAFTTIKAGVELNTDLLNMLNSILADLAEQVSVPKLKQQLREVKQQLDGAYRAQAEIGSLEAKRTRQTQLQAEAETVQARIQVLTTELDEEAVVQDSLVKITAAIAQLDNPRGRCQIFQRDLEQQSELEAAYAEHERARAALDEAIAALEADLAQFATLDQDMDAQRQQRQQVQASYQIYLQNQTLAAGLADLEARLTYLEQDLDQLKTQENEAQHAYEQATQDYDPNAWQEIEATYADLRSRADQLRGQLPEQQKRLQDYEARLSALSELAEKRDRAQTELKAKEQVKRFVNFARKVYKDAGPRVTERYVHAIAREADRLFRELLNRQNVTLQWTRDYEILVQEGAHQRRFMNLSGGEQMCAALAIRLALLRVLADLDVAFFDEPTTNMDRPRRQSLAEAIANIKTFRQLFVISHDDTFEQFTENLVLVERE